MSTTAMMRAKKTHKTLKAEQKKKRIEKTEKVIEMLMKHKEEHSDAEPTHIKGWTLGEENKLVKSK